MFVDWQVDNCKDSRTVTQLWENCLQMDFSFCHFFLLLPTFFYDIDVLFCIQLLLYSISYHHIKAWPFHFYSILLIILTFLILLYIIFFLIELSTQKRFLFFPFETGLPLVVSIFIQSMLILVLKMCIP